jgi:hypothetical protein
MADPVHTIDEVLARLQALDQALPPTDGVRWFNRLYLDTCQALGVVPANDSGQHQDYNAVNAILGQTEASTKQWLLTGAIKEHGKPGAVARARCLSRESPAQAIVQASSVNSSRPSWSSEGGSTAPWARRKAGRRTSRKMPIGVGPLGSSARCASE